VRRRVARELEARLTAAVSHLPSHVSVKGRVKSFDSYFRKYLRYLKASSISGSTGTVSIPDKIGLRILCPFLEDIQLSLDAIKAAFEVVEVERKGAGSVREFGYESIHLLIRIPEDIRKKHEAEGEEVAEIQVRTILQEAWAEVEHELVYKAEFTPFDNRLKRKLASVNAMLSLADTIFQETRDLQRRMNAELGKRRTTFYRKIEESTDRVLFDDADEALPVPAEGEIRFPALATSTSLDDILLNALYAHNKGLFEKAVEFYSRILDMKPPSKIVSLVYKHRGMAYFAQSRYDDAVSDFTSAFDVDGSAYKALYYRGVVRSVQGKPAEAVEDYTASLAVHPYQAFCLYRRAQAYYHLDDYAAALADCEAALEMSADLKGAAKLKERLMDALKM